MVVLPSHRQGKEDWHSAERQADQKLHPTPRRRSGGLGIGNRRCLETLPRTRQAIGGIQKLGRYDPFMIYFEAKNSSWQGCKWRMTEKSFRISSFVKVRGVISFYEEMQGIFLIISTSPRVTLRQKIILCKVVNKR